MPQAGRFLSCQEAARFLDLSDDTIRRLIHAGKLDAVRVGKRCLRVTAESVRRFAEPVVIPTGGFSRAVSEAEPAKEGHT
ncbi:MAG: helix-turn-helix domain-containing protein [Planctomycetes bacterium]|nr:helix-turn-helix domain-containing protein [Planctomycetota bacterium]